jgi:hypothetical protein
MFQRPHTGFFAIIIGFAVIAYWRGIWDLLDLYLFPNDRVVSYTISVIVGLLILLFTKHLKRALMD